MELTHRGVTYTFDYDFATNDGTCMNVSTVVDGHELDGEVTVTNIRVAGRPRPVTTVVLSRLREAAERAELEHRLLMLRRLVQGSAFRRGCIALVTR
jgi:hypothetical protein